MPFNEQLIDIHYMERVNVADLYITILNVAASILYMFWTRMRLACVSHTISYKTN